MNWIDFFPREVPQVTENTRRVLYGVPGVREWEHTIELGKAYTGPAKHTGPLRRRKHGGQWPKLAQCRR